MAYEDGAAAIGASILQAVSVSRDGAATLAL